MLFRKFELIPIYFGCLQIFEFAQKSSERPWGYILSKVARREFFILLQFWIVVKESLAYT